MKINHLSVFLLSMIAVFPAHAKEDEANANARSKAAREADAFEALVQLPTIRTPAVSPRGDRFAVTVSRGNTVAVAIDHRGKENVTIVPLGGFRPTGLYWADDENLLLDVGFAIEYRDYAVVEDSRTLLYRLGWEETAVANPSFRNTRWTSIEGVRQGEKGTELLWLAYSLNYDKKLIIQQINDNFYSARAKSVGYWGEKGTSGYLINRAGDVVYRIDNKGGKLSALHEFENLRNSNAVLVNEIAKLPKAAALGLGESDSEVWISALNTSGRRAAIKMDTRTGEELQRIEDDVYDTEAYLAAFRHDHVEGVVRRDETSEVIWFNPELENRSEELRAHYPDARIAISSWSDNYQQVTASVWKPRRLDEIIFYDAATSELRSLGYRYREFGDRELARVEPFRFNARDGVELEGYRTHSIEVPSKGMVLLPHGGPSARDSLAFDWWRQSLAFSGFDVMQVNFRGSSGYGIEFEVAGHGGWGRGVMQHDLTDSVAHAIAEGWAEEGNIAIMGASYGGYAALAGAAFTPELYKCAVSVNGVSDLDLMLRREDRFAAPWIAEYWAETTGRDDGGKDITFNASPINFADQIKADVLLIHGERDSVVFKEQSERMARALRKAGKPNKAQIIDMDHWLTQPEGRLRTMTLARDFLNACMAAGK